MNLMKRNDDHQFVGVEKLKAKQKWQLDQFQSWAAESDWGHLHREHYDWWMFPTDEPSSKGLAWTVYEGDIVELNSDAQYVRNYLEGVRLLALSWGWEVDKQTYVVDPLPEQQWQHRAIRLYKCVKSLKLFGHRQYFDSMKQYTLALMRQDEDLTLAGRSIERLLK